MNLPEARKDNLLTTELDDEVVVYDPERKQAHSLNRTALAVWNHSDGQTSLGDLQQRVSTEVGLPISEATVWLALQKLERAHLLSAKLQTAAPVTRRQVLGKAGRMGAAAVAAPIVFSALVPVAAAAVTPLTCTGVGGGQVSCNAVANCTCFRTVGSGTSTTCLQTIPSALTACVADATCTALFGAGSTCQTDPSTLTKFCTCASNAQCGGIGAGSCVPNTNDFCHVPCGSAATCVCP